MIRWIVTGSFSFTSLLMMAFGVPLWLGKIPPNAITGFRVAATLNDPKLWYLVNATMGREMFALGFVLLLLTWIVHFSVPDRQVPAAALALVAVLVIGSIAMATHGWYLSRS